MSSVCFDKHNEFKQPENPHGNKLSAQSTAGIRPFNNASVSWLPERAGN
tara:strand:+ start:624 stop:770 length:147 start_codon:yes stop_codon:yes gene_type:complete